MFSLRYKLVLTITLLIAIVLGSAALLFVRQREQESVRDALTQVQSFARFTSDRVVADYELYWAQKGYVYFNRSIQDILSRSPVITGVDVYQYDGTLLYDSATEHERAYQGAPRIAKDAALVSRITAKVPSLQTEGGDTVFLDSNPDGTVRYRTPFDETQRVTSFVFPLRDQYAIVYHVSYDEFTQRFIDTRNRIIALAAFAILLGAFVAFIFSSRITRSINQLVVSAATIAKGDFSHRVEIHTGDELEILGSSFNTMAGELDKSLEEKVYRERVAKELELAAKIQMGILPKTLPNIPSLDIAAGLIPAEEVGGDCYDFLATGDDDRTLMYLGDVTGHGVPAGIQVSVANALFYYFSKKFPLKEVLVEVNSVMKAKSPSNMFMTLALLEWGEQKKELRYVNAGHEPLIHAASNGTVQEFHAGGVALGMIPDIAPQLKEMMVPLAVGDVLVIYSDGLPECWKDEKEIYGMERLKKTIAAAARLPSALAIRNSILADIKQYEGNYKQMDDMTIIVVKRRV